MNVGGHVRWATIIFFGLGVIIVAATLIAYLLNPTLFNGGIETLLIRLAAGLVIVLPAFYTAKESARHRTNADRAKQTELELASLGPFMELLPEDKKNEIRASLMPSYFGTKVADHEAKSLIDADGVTKVVKSITELITTARS